MNKCRLLAGVAGLSFVFHGFAAYAQASSTSPQVSSTSASPQPAPAQECSGLHCLLGWHFDSEPSNDARPSAPGAPNPSDAAKPVLAKAAKPAHVVTIAADAPEMARLKRMAAALPREKIKIVKARGAVDKANSDFSVSTALDPVEGSKTTKLFTEQLHIVAGGAVHAIGDLDGKVVSFGPDKSPSQAAGRKAFEALNIHVEETPLDIDNALDGLSTGDLDAVVLLAPQPIDRLKTFSAPGAHLVSWPEGGTLPTGATAATIDVSAYPRLVKSGEAIRAMGVGAILTISQKGTNETAAKSFLKALSQNSDVLAKRGFDLIKADLGGRNGRHLASVDRIQ